MNFTIDEITKDVLVNSLKEAGKKAIRIVITGFSWGGPTFGIVLDEQKDGDDFFNLSEISSELSIKLSIVVEKDLSFLFDNGKIIASKNSFGNSFSVLTGNGESPGC